MGANKRSNYLTKCLKLEVYISNLAEKRKVEERTSILLEE